MSAARHRGPHLSREVEEEEEEEEGGEVVREEESVAASCGRRRRTRCVQGLCVAVNALCASGGVYMGVTGDWWGAARLCVGSAGGASLLRARRRLGANPVSRAVLAFHGALGVELATRTIEARRQLGRRRRRFDDNVVVVVSSSSEKKKKKKNTAAAGAGALKKREVMAGREVGYDDDFVEIGWERDVENLDAVEVSRRHARLISDAEVARKRRDARVRKTWCWTGEKKEFQCVPEVYVLGAPKCGTSELWESLVSKAQVVKGRRKETRFFTRGEFGMPADGYLDASTRLEAFSRAHSEAAEIIEAEADESGFSDKVLVDGGPHTLWWPTQAHDGSDTGAAPIPQLVRLLVPGAKLIATLAEPGRRSYSDYWFLTERGVARPREELGQSAEDFHAKVKIDTTAMELCFDRFSGESESRWPLGAVQRCAFDKFHFGRNGRGRIAVGLYAAYVARWLDVFDRSQLLVVRLEDLATEGHSRVFDFLGLEKEEEVAEARVVNRARSARPPMRAETARLLQRFYQPHNARLAELLGDRRFLWEDALPNDWANVTGRKKPPPPKALNSGISPDMWGKKRRKRRPPEMEFVRNEEKRVHIAERQRPIIVAAARGETEALKKAAAAARNNSNDGLDLGDALVLGALRADPRVVEAVLEFGADPNARLSSERERGRGTTPLHVACLAACWGDSMRGSLVFKLLEGASSPVDYAIEHGKTEAGRRLSMRGHRTTVSALEIREAIAKAVADVARALVAFGADASARDDDGRAPAHYCAQGGFVEALKVIAAASPGSAALAAEAKHGSTPAHLAALWGQAETLRALVVDLKADPDIRDNHGHSVRDLALGPGAPVSPWLAEDPEFATALGGFGGGGFGGAPVRRRWKRDLDRNHGGGWRPANARDVDILAGEADDFCDFDVVDAADVDGQTLFEKYLAKNRPVLLRGIVDTPEWDAARAAYGVEDLVKTHGSASVTVSAIPYAKKFSSDLGARGLALSEYVVEMLNATLDREKYPWYVFRGHPVNRMPDEPDSGWFVPADLIPPPDAILDAFSRAADLATPKADRPPGGREEDNLAGKNRFWPFVNVQWALGSAGSGAPMHFHNTAWNACIYGAKRWIAYPPAYNLMSNDQIRLWDETIKPAQESIAGQPKAFECIQRRGDVAIIPELWGHGVLNLQDTVAVATEVKGSLFRAPLPRAYKKLQVFNRDSPLGDPSSSF
ncbi:hypothetical protein CTAYLR_008063 [Chrysophaeum taylorii]|uniref:JmjC domain-containing protein n=1 Tax=Chrysophaeum taylorii TaxID=2483200 RepID=A0AAD7UK29_9STRA|nr:hypothetical protein CTAYLR_008063 [Chrysophaeum taylorii]